MGLKKLAILLAVILALMLGFAALFYFGANLKAEVSIATASAGDYPEAFASIRNLVEDGSAPQIFTGSALGDASLYQLVDVTITLENHGFFDAEWVDLRVEPAAGDVAVYSLSGEGGTVAARTVDQVNLKLITTARADALRAYRVQYYVYGMKREIILE